MKDYFYINRQITEKEWFKKRHLGAMAVVEFDNTRKNKQQNGRCCYDTDTNGM